VSEPNIELNLRAFVQMVSSAASLNSIRKNGATASVCSTDPVPGSGHPLVNWMAYALCALITIPLLRRHQVG
jgi:hypothetical protein